jgi:hypothetical protein
MKFCRISLAAWVICPGEHFFVNLNKISIKTEIARLSPLAITQTSIIIKYSLTDLYVITPGRVTKKNSGEQHLSNKFYRFNFNW